MALTTLPDYLRCNHELLGVSTWTAMRATVATDEDCIAQQGTGNVDALRSLLVLPEIGSRSVRSAADLVPRRNHYCSGWGCSSGALDRVRSE